MRGTLLVVALLAATVPAAGAHELHLQEESPDLSGVLFEPPLPGTYELPPIRRVRDHRLVGRAGRSELLLGLAPGQVAVVSFIYRGCSDAGGCPAALAFLQRLDRQLARRPELARHTRLATVSFDPEHDTPSRMAELAAALDPKTDWRFLTAVDSAALDPVLDDFDQSVVRLVTAVGEQTRILRHVLKVFLVDEGGAVRNIYSAGFLDWRIVMNDILTLVSATD